MLRAMLEDRFNLKLRREMKEMPVYVLSAGTNASEKLKPLGLEGAVSGGTFNSVGPYNGLTNVKPLKLNYGDAIVGGIGGRLSMDRLASELAWVTKKPVLDLTGIPGVFRFEMFYAPVEFRPDSYFVNEAMRNNRPVLGSPSLFKALEDDLGLRLESSRAPVEILVVDSIDKPTEN
jgi:uncharacterized protein (TIGR03435 family)